MSYTILDIENDDDERDTLQGVSYSMVAATVAMKRKSCAALNEEDKTTGR